MPDPPRLWRDVAAEMQEKWGDYPTLSAKLYDREKARESEQRACREAIERAADLAAKLAAAEQYAAVCNSGCERAMQVAEQASTVTGALTKALAAAERDRAAAQDAWDELWPQAEEWKAQLDRAEAALVVAQEAMREAAAREIEEAPLLENADMQAWAKRDMELAAIVRALPVPAVVSASAEPTTTGNLVGSSPKGEIPFPNLQPAAKPEVQDND